MTRPAIHALEFLAAASPPEVPPVCVVFGAESFLKREVLTRLKQRVLDPEQPDCSLSMLAGNTADPTEVFDELSTVTLFGSAQRCVVIEQADEFVRRHRAALEQYVANPSRRGVLLLEVGTWSKGTRLYNELARSGLQIECKPPPRAKLKAWLVARAEAHHRVRLPPAAADLMLELIDPELGLLDQELAKLALLVEKNATIARDLVEKTVGTWRRRTTWELIDAAAAGDARAAIAQLDRLLVAGEQPIVVLAQMASTLRRFAAATARLQAAGPKPSSRALAEALAQAGVPSFVLGKSQQQLMQLGRQRASKIYGWLLAADLALKGSSSSAERARIVLEELLVRLSKTADPRRRTLGV